MTDHRERLQDAIASAARTVPIRIGPNALAMAQRGDTLALSGGEAAEVGRVVLETLEAMGAIDYGGLQFRADHPMQGCNTSMACVMRNGCRRCRPEGEQP